MGIENKFSSGIDEVPITVIKRSILLILNSPSSLSVFSNYLLCDPLPVLNLALSLLSTSVLSTYLPPVCS